jgi:FkbM family methyltransferase
MSPPVTARDRRIFLDVGAHTGETLRAVLDPRYRFDPIMCFEPAAACVESLKRFRDHRCRILPFGLWRESGELPLYDPGSVGASIYADKQGTDEKEIVNVVRATDWFRQNIRLEDTVFLKLNCEGAECDILEDLLHSGEIRKVDHLLVHFDVRKIRSQVHREEEVSGALEAAGIKDFVRAEDVLIGPSHIARVRNWLESVGADEYFRLRPMERVRSSLRTLQFVHLPAAVQHLGLGRVARRMFPPAWHALLQSVIYPEAKERRP